MDESIGSYLEYLPETGELFWKRDIGKRIKAGSKAGTYDRLSGYVRLKFKGKRLLAHRVDWFLYHGVWPVGVIDHINRNKTDNRICNLRDTTHGENTRNSDSFHKETSGTFRTGKNRWAARITVNKKTNYLGTYDSLEKAHQSYLDEVKKI